MKYVLDVLDQGETAHAERSGQHGQIFLRVYLVGVPFSFLQVR